MPVSFRFNEGITFPTASAAPVDDGIILCNADLPPLQSLEDGASTVINQTFGDNNEVRITGAGPWLHFKRCTFGSGSKVLYERDSPHGAGVIFTNCQFNGDINLAYHNSGLHMNGCKITGSIFVV